MVIVQFLADKAVVVGVVVQYYHRIICMKNRLSSLKRDVHMHNAREYRRCVDFVLNNLT